MTTASKITMSRVALVPVFLLFMLSDIEYSNYIALAIFIVASATDGIDGYIARRYNQITDFGKFIDPLADKLLVTAAILIFVQWGQMPGWAAMLVIAREFAVTGLRLVAVGNERVIAAAYSGKVKTVTSIIAICIMLTPLRDFAVIPEVLTMNEISVAAMVITTIWSGVEYFVKNMDVLKAK